MIIETIPVGEVQANCYILGCEKTQQAAIIDPGAEPERILKLLEQTKLSPKYIINTHGHIDHIGANRAIKEATNVPILIHEEDAPMLTKSHKNLSLFMFSPVTSPPADRLLQENDIIEVGTLKLKVRHTPGHTKGGIILQVNDVVFTGDTLFAGSIGRTDFPGGSYNTLLDSIRHKLLTLDDDVTIYTGHGPTSTIGYERRNNPFLQF